MHGRINSAEAGGGSCRVGGRATVALLTLGLVVLGVHIGLMIDIAHSDREAAAAAAAPTVHGSGAMAFHVLRAAGGVPELLLHPPVQQTDQQKFIPANSGHTAVGRHQGARKRLHAGRRGHAKWTDRPSFWHRSSSAADVLSNSDGRDHTREFLGASCTSSVWL